MDEILGRKLETLRHFFDVDNIINCHIDQEYVSSYYLVNKLPYSFFHSKEHFVHMGITRESQYSNNDLYVQAEEIERLIRERSAKNVLELASGRGGNSAWLAQNNPDVSFVGMDISSTQLSFARKHEEKLKNFQVVQGSFQDLGQFADESMDIVFIIEALCHSENTDKVLREVFRVLKKDGLFAIYDGYRTKRKSDYSPEELRLIKLLEVGVAVNQFDTYNEFIEIAEHAGLHVSTHEDLSRYVLPTMRRFERKAMAFFKLGLLAKVLLKVLPTKFSYNIISGYLFPSVIEAGLFSYNYTLLKKSMLG